MEDGDEAVNAMGEVARDDAALEVDDASEAAAGP